MGFQLRLLECELSHVAFVATSEHTEDLNATRCGGGYDHGARNHDLESWKLDISAQSCFAPQKSLCYCLETLAATNPLRGDGGHLGFRVHV